jgi:hypothetical protein
MSSMHDDAKRRLFPRFIDHDDPCGSVEIPNVTARAWLGWDGTVLNVDLEQEPEPDDPIEPWGLSVSVPLAIASDDVGGQHVAALGADVAGLLAAIDRSEERWAERRIDDLKKQLAEARAARTNRAARFVTRIVAGRPVWFEATVAE